MLKAAKGYSILLIGLATLAAFGGPQTNAEAVRTTHGVITFGPISTEGGAGFLPLLDLSEMLAKHPQSRFFRIDWTDGVGSYSETGTLFYDRRRAMLECICKGDYNAGSGMRGDWYQKNAVREHFLIRRVSPANIAKAAAAARQDNSVLVAVKELTHFGGTQRTLSYQGLYQRRMPRHKKARK